jgi:hypothetical protein
MGEAGSTNGSDDIYKILVGKPEGKRPFGIARHIWDDNIKMYSKERGCGFVDWIRLAQDRVQWRGLVSIRLHTKRGNFSFRQMNNYYLLNNVSVPRN